jgi:predicted metal-dependent phosphoesterase TrpH
MARGDFHLHSSHSDGILSPEDLVAKAASNGVETMALTDHDTTAGVDAAVSAGEALGVRVIPGVELSADLPGGGDAHILGYFASIDDPALQDQLGRYRDGRMQRGRTMLDKLAALDMPLSWERLLEIAGEAAVGRPHVAQAMVEREYVASVREAFDRFLHTGGPADATREKLLPADALALIARSGGIAVLAHPSFLPDPPVAIAELASMGLRGLEVFYKNYDNDEISRFADLARQNELLPLGGSDYHGIHDDEREPGNIPLPDEVIATFLAFAEDHWNAVARKDGS